MEVSCACCSKLFNKFPNQIKKSSNHYCSRSCAAKMNNVLCPKRKLEGKCVFCGVGISSKLKKCFNCREAVKEKLKIKKESIRKRDCDHDLCLCGESKSRRSTLCKLCYEKQTSLNTKSDLIYHKIDNAASRYTRLREHARNVAKANGLYKKGCLKCGYKLHVEICHKKSIKDFPDDALVIEINHIDNLIPLCRNCHWEFDHGIFEI